MLPDRARKGLEGRGLADILRARFIRWVSDSVIVCHEVSDILGVCDLVLLFRPVGIHEAERLCCLPRVALTEEVPELVEVLGLDVLTRHGVGRHAGI